MRPAIDTPWCGARKGRDQSSGLVAREVTEQAPDLRDLEGFGQLQGREDAGQAAGEHGLAGAGRPAEEEVMAARGCDLEGAAGLLLTVHLAEVVLGGLDFCSPCAVAYAGCGSIGCARVMCAITPARFVHGDHLEAFDQARPRRASTRERRVRSKPWRRSQRAATSTPST